MKILSRHFSREGFPTRRSGGLARVLVGFSALAACAVSALAQPVDEFRIPGDVVQRNAPNFSTNLRFGVFAPWNSDLFVNAWNLPFAAGPIHFQQHGQADTGGADWLEHRNGGGLSRWDSGRSGFWDGAEVWLYRITDGVMTHYRTATVATSSMGKDPATGEYLADQKLWFTQGGEAVRSGDFYVLRMRSNIHPPQYRPALSSPSAHPLLNGYCQINGNGTWSFDESTKAPEGGSLASLRINAQTASPAVPCGPWHWYVLTGDSANARTQFRPGKQYKAQVWLRQEGMSDPRVTLQFGTVMTRTVTVDSQWRKFEFDLPVHSPEAPYRTLQGNDTRMLIGAVSAGTFWIDNFVVYQADEPPFAVMREEIQTLRDFKPHTLRLWGGLEAPSLDYWLESGFAMPTAMRDYGKTANPVMVSLAQSLKVCEEVGADPWLILNPWFTPEENAKLMEYLAAPADVGYGQVRASHGRVEPWTTAFRKIHIESANEAWNSIMRYHVSQPEVYAAIADRQFRELKASPHFTRDKFEFIANGWDNSMSSTGWTRRVAAASREADRVDVAYYFGGWEKGLVAGDDADAEAAEVFQDKLFGATLEFGRVILDSLLMDTGFANRLARAMQADPALLSSGLADIPVGSPVFAPEALQAAPGDLAGLWAKDTDFASSIRSVVAVQRSYCDNAFLHAAYRAVATDSALRPTAISALDLADPAILYDLAEGLMDSNAPSRLLPLFKSNPVSVQAWSQVFTGTALTDLNSFIQNQDKLTYNITNELNRRLREAVLSLARAGNADFLEALRREATQDLISSKFPNYLNYVVASSFSGSPARRIQHLLQAMKASPDYAGSVFDAIAQSPAALQTEAEAIASIYSNEIIALHAQGQPFRANDDDRLLLRALPESTRLEMWQRMSTAIGDAGPALGETSRRLLDVVVAAQLGETAPALSLTSNTAFVDSLSQLLMDRLAEPFLTAAKGDAALGDRLLSTLAAIPNPTAKKLAVYEGGPGYSLPGPGLPVPEADENIGKSLAMGTATLDASLQFLAAAGTPLAYYDYKTGEYWSSHNNPVDRVPYPTWLALGMKNRLCPGDLLRVDPLAVGSIDIADKQVYKTNNDGTGSLHTIKGRKGVHLLSCHAFRNGQDVSLLILNRSLDQARSATLRMPADHHGAARLHVLTHSDPKANNRFQQNVAVVELDGPDFRDGMVVTVPPASVVVVTGGRAGTPLPMAISNNSTLDPLLLGDLSSLQFAGEGGIRPYSWSLHSGTLPPGMALDAISGRLTGAPEATGSYGFQIQMEDVRGRKLRKSFSVRVNPDTPRITALELPAAVTGEEFAHQFEATLGKPPYTWTATSALPPGLILGEDGLLSGTPPMSAAGNYSVAVRATGVNGQFRGARFPLEVRLSEAPVVQTAMALPPGEVGQQYPAGVVFQATGGKAPYSWRLLSGPAGLLVSQDGTLSGYPAEASPGGDPTPLRVRVTGADGRTATGDFGVAIQPSLAPLVSAADLLPTARIGVPYRLVLNATGGNGSLSFEAISGLPEGFTLTSLGVLSGVALETDTHSILVRVADASGASSFRSLTLRAVHSATPVITGPTRVLARLGVPLDAALIAVGGVLPYQWSVATGTLPPGVTLNASTGVLEGVPSATGTSVFTSRVTDANGRSHTFSHSVVVSLDAPLIDRAALSPGTSGEFYSHRFQATLGQAPYTWTVASGLPAGLEISADGLLSGTPPHSAARNHSLLVRATGANGVSSAFRFPLVIALSEAPRIQTDAALPDGELGQAYVGVAFQAEGGNLPHRWVLVSGPKGLSMSAEGLLSGYPAESGDGETSLPLRVRVFSATGRVATGDFSIRIHPTASPVISNGEVLPGARIGLAYRVVFAVQGGTAPYRFSALSPLPGGLALGENGVLAGKTIEPATTKFLVRVEDATGAASVKEFTLKSVHSTVPVITGPSRIPGRVGLPLEVPLEAVGGTLPYQWSVASETPLPEWLTLHAATGVLSGTPVEPGVWSFSSIVTDANGRTHTLLHSLGVVWNRPVIAREVLEPAVAGSGYSHDFQASLGIAPYLWSATTALPRGLSLSPDGELRGIPATNAIGNHTLSIRVTGDDGLASTLRFPFTVLESAGLAPMSYSMSPMSVPFGVSDPVLEPAGTPGRFVLRFTATTNLPMKVQVCRDLCEGFQDVPNSYGWASEGLNEIEVEVPAGADRAYWRVVVDEGE